MARRRPVATALAGLGAIALALPLIYGVSVSLMTPVESRTLPPPLVPQSPQLHNYVTGWFGAGLSGLLLTTVLLAGLAALLQVLTGSAAAFALARLRFAGRRAVLRAFVILAALPSIVLLVPRFVMIDAWGWTDDFTGLAAPALVSAGAVLFLYQVFRMLPREPEESARLEGAGEWTIFVRVVVPQARSALVVVGGLAALAQWRSLLWPLVVTRRVGPEVAEEGLALRIATLAGLSVPELLAVGVAISVPAILLAAWVVLARARPLEREFPPEVSALTPGPFEHQIL